MDPIPLRTSPTLNTFEQKRNQVAPVSRRFNRCILRSESCVAFADSNVDGTVDRSGSVREITMRNDGSYQPKAEHKFSFGLWTLGNRGRDPFGDFVRPVLSPGGIVGTLAEVGAWGVNLHDNDLVPIDATPAERDAIVRAFRKSCEQHHVVVPMATVSLFFHPVFRDGAFTANDPEVRAYALQKTMRAMDLGAELGAKIFVLWGGREGVETDACRRPDQAVKRLREAVNYLCEYNIDRGYGFRLALEAKPNEPRGDLYMASTDHYLGFIATLDHPEMVGVNPEMAHEQMAGLNFLHRGHAILMRTPIAPRTAAE
jgi:xylose isomerase